MYGYSARINGPSGPLAPSQFRDSARNTIYQQLPVIAGQSSATSVRSAPTQLRPPPQNLKLRQSLALSVFSWGKRSVRSAPSIYSSSTATIPEDSEPVSTTVEQLINDISLHENYCKEQLLERKSRDPRHAGALVQELVASIDDLEYEDIKISLGSDLSYQNTPEFLVGWNLNVTRCKLMLTDMPMVSSSPDLRYLPNSLPQLVGDLALVCHITLLLPTITDTELIYTLFSSNIYTENDLDSNFKRSVAEVSVKQSRLLQISQQSKNHPSPITPEQSHLTLRYKEIAVRNYLVNLAAAATTAHEYKVQSDAMKRELRAKLAPGEKTKLSKDEKKQLWVHVRSDVFRRAGLEE